MSDSAWFDDKFYAEQKVLQMNTISWQGRSDWDEAGYRAELARFGVTAQENFEACNTTNYISSIGLTAVNVSPNQLFDMGIYLQNYVNWANGPGQYSYGAIESGQWTVQSMLEHIFNDLHMSAWAHFQQVGMGLELNPSNLFDTSAYLADRAAAMNSYVNNDGSLGWRGKTDWTKADVLAELAANDVNPVEDYFDTGNPVFHISASLPAKPTVMAVAGWTPWGNANTDEETPGTPGTTPPAETPGSPTWPQEPADPYETIDETIVLTPEGADYNGASGKNTLFVGAYCGANSDSTTVRPDDVIDGGANSHNTLEIAFDKSWETGFSEGKISNIGLVRLNLSQSLDGEQFAFSSRNIENAERIDIASQGAAAIQLNDITASVSEINIDSPEIIDFSFSTVDGAIAPQDQATLAINGEINNLQCVFDCPQPGTSGEDPIKFMPAISADAIGDINISVKNFARVIGNSSFDFNSARGDATVTIEGNDFGDNADPAAGHATWGNSTAMPLRFNAANARSFVLKSDGAIGASDIYTVVDNADIQDGYIRFTVHNKGMTLPDTVSINNTGIMLNANGASRLAFDVTGQFRIANGRLDNVKDLDIVLEKNVADDKLLSLSNSFDMANIDLPSAGNVSVNGGGMNVMLGAIGSDELASDVSISVQNANYISLRGARTGSGGDIAINLQSADYAEIVDNICADKIAGGVRGNITLKVDTGPGRNFDGLSANHVSGEENSPGWLSITGNDVNVDVSSVGGNVAAMNIAAEGTIKYDGNHNDDHLVLTSLGGGNSSISLGTGNDSLQIALNDESGKAAGIYGSGMATLAVDLGTASNDWLGVRNVDSGILLVKVENYTVVPNDGNSEVTNQMDSRIITGGANFTAADTARVIDLLQSIGINASSNLQYVLTEYGFDDPAMARRIDRVATWYDPDSQTSYYVNGSDSETGITVIEVGGIANSNDAQNVFGYADWAE